jgi:hypothetical protein
VAKPRQYFFVGVTLFYEELSIFAPPTRTIYHMRQVELFYCQTANYLQQRLHLPIGAWRR